MKFSDLSCALTPCDVDVDVVQEPRGPPCRRRPQRGGLLAVDDAVGLLGDGDRLQAGDERRRRRSRGVERGEARGVAALGEQQRAVLGEHPAGAPGRVVAGLAREVRDVELVAHERQARARAWARSCTGTSRRRRSART